MKQARRWLVAAMLAFAVCAVEAQAPGPLICTFAFRPYRPHVGQPIQFWDTSRGAVTARLWEFGDGTTSAEQNPTHVFGAAGEFEVSLTVSDGITTATATMGR